MNKSELLLPVGNYQMCLAAIHNGADAIYVGMPEFNARGRSHDHSWDELKEIIELAHLYGVKVNIAFNILIFENEFQRALEVLDQAIALGPDALIIQDIGLISLIKQRYPHQVIHGSTQMTFTNHEAINLLDDLNIKRFVLGRENSIPEIKLIKQSTDKELEVFVHGALCVAYSGQCFTSESLGGRSANRGQCAQSCRFDYEIFVDDKKKELGNHKYLVSPQDLCGIEEIPQLLDMGVESFKVEGRLKSPEFVGTVAKNYRKRIDGEIKNVEEAKNDMAATYSRGFYPGWLNGVAHQELVEGTFKANRGSYIGQIQNVLKSEFVIEKNTELKAGDGLLIVDSNNNEFGEKIYSIALKGDFYFIKLGPKVNLSNLSKDQKVYLTRKESLVKDVSASINNRDLTKKIPISITVQGESDEHLVIIVEDGSNTLTLTSETKLETAVKNPLVSENFSKALGGLSHSPYKLNHLINKTKGDLYIHNRSIKKLKQAMVAGLNEVRVRVPEFETIEYSLPEAFVSSEPVTPKLNILIRKASQLDDLLTYFKGEGSSYLDSVESIILDFEFGKDYFPSVKKLKEDNIKVAIATTRILKPTEYHNFKLIERCKPDTILVRNLGALNYFKNKGYNLIGDFSLNCANSLTHKYLISKGLDSVTSSYDLNIDQLNDLIKNSDSSKLEVTLHQYMAEFHMEHCVYAAFLSKGNSFRDCGKPCEKHEVYLKDMYGNRHDIKADQECRNTLFNSKANSTAKYLKDWVQKGVKYYRFECLHESAEELISKVDSYLKLMNNEITLDDAYKTLGKAEKYGLGSEVLDNKKEYKSIKKSFKS
jgi:putative protease